MLGFAAAGAQISPEIKEPYPGKRGK
jgi:hypothetical protein